MQPITVVPHGDVLPIYPAEPHSGSGNFPTGPVPVSGYQRSSLPLHDAPMSRLYGYYPKHRE
jgi:hypothetical protein